VCLGLIGVEGSLEIRHSARQSAQANDLGLIGVEGSLEIYKTAWHSRVGL